MIGTPAYMSPEQAGCVRARHRHAERHLRLGMVLYELLTGVLPFDPRSIELLHIHRTVRPGQ